jgi:CO/xanthine dehydrogenase Mo-binding subunit
VETTCVCFCIAAASGRIAAIDTTAAARVPGVLAVFTHKDRIKLAKDPGVVDPSSPADRALQVLQDDRGQAVRQQLQA